MKTERIEICPDCQGTGKIRPKGEYVRVSLDESDWVQGDDCDCPTCLGSGRIIATITPYCCDRVYNRNCGGLTE